jgi:hypothetical protein
MIFWRIRLFIAGLLQKVLFTVQFYNYLQLASMVSPFSAAVRPTHLLTSRTLNSPASTISKAVPSHDSHALQPSSFFGLSSDSYAVDPLPARNGLSYSPTLLSLGNSLGHCSASTQLQLRSPLVVHSPQLFPSLTLVQHWLTLTNQPKELTKGGVLRRRTTSSLARLNHFSVRNA